MSPSTRARVGPDPTWWWAPSERTTSMPSRGPAKKRKWLMASMPGDQAVGQPTVEGPGVLTVGPPHVLVVNPLLEEPHLGDQPYRVDPRRAGLEAPQHPLPPPGFGLGHAAGRGSFDAPQERTGHRCRKEAPHRVGNRQRKAGLLLGDDEMGGERSHRPLLAQRGRVRTESPKSGQSSARSVMWSARVCLERITSQTLRLSCAPVKRDVGHAGGRLSSSMRWRRRAVRRARERPVA